MLVHLASHLLSERSCFAVTATGECSSRRRRSLHSLLFPLFSSSITPPLSAALSIRVKHFQYRDQSPEFLTLSGAKIQQKQKPHSRLPQITSSRFTHTHTTHLNAAYGSGIKKEKKKDVLASSKCMLPLVGSGVILDMKGCGF